MSRMKTWTVPMVVGAALFVCGFGIKQISVPDIEAQQTALFRSFGELETMGAFVVGEKGERLGTIARVGGDALGNDFGMGSEFKTDGLFNKYGKHGSPYATTSAFNPLATNPPKVVVEKDGDLYSVGLLTLNKQAETKGQRINPHLLRAWLKQKSQ